MRIYWLHILESKSPQSGMPSTYTLARANDPDRHAEGGAMPTVHYPAWEQLAGKLSAIGFGNSVLQSAKEDLDSTGGHTLPFVSLTDDELKQLGFADVAD